MELVKRVEQILSFLRPVFSRQAAFRWFVLLFWSIVLVQGDSAITRYLNVLGLSEKCYHQALHWFNATSWSARELSQRWGKWLSRHEQAKRLRGKLVYIGDGIKVAKAGLKMPLVKKLKQTSQNVNKPNWIRGHHFGMLSLLMGQGEALYAVPITTQLQEGLITQQLLSPQKQLYLAEHSPLLFVLWLWLESFYEPFNRTLVEQMVEQTAEFVSQGSIVVLDAFYAVKKLVRSYRGLGVILLTRVRSNTIAYAPFERIPGAKGRGRPRRWGSRVKLAELFRTIETFQTTTVTLYGRLTVVRYCTLQLHWDSPEYLVQFVLSVLPCGRQLILMTNDLDLSAAEIIMAYNWRFKIEVSFRTLIHLLDGFAYRFWLKTLDKTELWPRNLALNTLTWTQQQALMAKVEAFERFVTLHGFVLGVLQVLALESPLRIRELCPQWFRSLPKHAQPCEQSVRITLRHLINPVSLKVPQSLLLHKFLTELAPPSTDSQKAGLTMG